MTGMDASFVYTETPTMHMHVVGVLVLDASGLPGRVGAEEVIAEMERRIHLMPPLRRRMVGVPAGIDHPVWIEDPDFDVRHHIHTAPLRGPVSWAALERFTGDVAGRPLDRGRPLWEMWVVEELEDGTVALVTKLHHAIMDGGAGGDLMASLFDLDPDHRSVAAEVEPWRPDAVPSRASLAVRSLLSATARQRQVPATVVRTLGDLAGTARAWWSQRSSGATTALTAPRTALNGAITARRSVSLTRVDLDVVRHIRHVFGTTVNDVVLAAAATSIRRYLQAHPPLPDRLIVSVPVSTRSAAAGRGLGNQVSNMMVPLDLVPDDPVQRLQSVHQATESAKALHAAGPQLLADLTGLATPSLLAAGARLYTAFKLARIHPPVMNAVISNVPGPPVDLYCAGARVVGVFPMGPVIEGTGLNVTVLSEAKHLNVGIMACPDLVGDVGELGTGFVAAVEELRRRAGPPERQSRRPGSGRPAKRRGSAVPPSRPAPGTRTDHASNGRAG